MSSARNPQVPNTTGDTQYNVHDAALRGASLAFSKPPLKPKPLTNTYTGGGNGALLAATKVGTGSTRNTTAGTASPLRHDVTGGSSRSGGWPDTSPMRFYSKSSSSSTLGVPDDHLGDRTPSPSNIAARLAAARYSPRKPMPIVSPTSAMSERSIMSERDKTERDMLPPAGSVGNVLARLDIARPNQQARPRPQRAKSSGFVSVASTLRVPAEEHKAVEDSSIPPTTSLVNMFEQNRPTTPPPNRADTPLHISQTASPPMRSPKPRRTFNLPPEPKEEEPRDTEPLHRARTRTPPPVKPKPIVDLTTAAADGPGESGFYMLRKNSPGAPPVRRKSVQLAAFKSTTAAVDGPGESNLSMLRKNSLDAPPVRRKSVQLAAFKSTTAAVDGPGESSFNMSRKNSLDAPPVRRKSVQLAAVKSTTPLHPMPPSRRGSRQARPLSASHTQDPARTPSFHARVSTSISMDSNENASSQSSFVSAQEEQETEKTKPAPPPPRRSARARSEAPATAPRPKSSYTPSPRSPSQVVSPISPPERFPRPSSTSAVGTSPPTSTLYHSNYQRESVRAIAKHLTGEKLSTAIVGAALASSRNASPNPVLTATPPLSTRKPHHHHHSPFHPTRSPSPPKPTGKMRSTMRKEKSSDSSEDESERYKKKGTRIMGMRRKHPNKHHEGTRKRWRDAITERERKRYEGVWAANKGLYIPEPRKQSEAEVMQDVLNLVAKELWMRSRLPEHELEEVWSLVDSRGIGRLRREEIVVGMWLIDQRLKGRKIPVRVSESVWDSVRGVGVKVKIVAHK